MQTIYPQLRRPPAPAYQRQRWDTPDGDFVDLDFTSSMGEAAPMLVLFHGLEGNSNSPYATAVMGALTARGWQGVVPHFRGCSGEPNRLPRAYHSGDHIEIDWILRRLRRENPARPLYVVGVSLGGSALLNWLGRQEAAAAPIVERAAAVCAPLDLPVAGHALGRGFNRLYAAHFLRTLKPAAMAKLARFPGLFEANTLAACRTLYAFDNVVTAPLHGFRDTEDYWRRASSKPWLRSIRVPTLLVNALNDPFVPAWALPSHNQVSAAVTLGYTASGGHVGYVSGGFPGELSWLPARLLSYLCDEKNAGAMG